MRHTTPTGKTFIVYHTNWATYGRNFQVSDLPIDYIPDIAYAFLNVKPDGSVVSEDAFADFEKRFANGVPPPDSWNDSDPAVFYGNLGQFSKLKRAGKRFNLQLSVGGWTWSKYFSDAASTPETRDRFATTLVAFLKRYPVFNGISLDWEYLSGDGKNYGNTGNSVRVEDPQNFIALVQRLRSELTANRLEDFHISLCVTPAPEKMAFPVAEVCRHLDEVHIMTYDFADGNWGDTIASHHTNLRTVPYATWSVERAVEAYLAQGVPSSKIFIGAAFYSRGFSNASALGRPCSGGSPDRSFEQGICDYKDLPRPGAVEVWDDAAQAAYSYDSAKGIINTYDTVRSIREKCKYVWEKDLAGIIVWESSGDVPIDSPRSLTRALWEGLVSNGTAPAVRPETPAVPVPVPPTTVRPETPLPVPPTTTDPIAPPPVAPVPPPACDPSSRAIWTPGVWYGVGDTVLHQGAMYKVIQAHRAQADWPPHLVPALFGRTP